MALALAAHLPMEVISADSRQVYRRLDVGTAKNPPGAPAGAPHGVDVVEPASATAPAATPAMRRAGSATCARGASCRSWWAAPGLYIRALVDGIFVERHSIPSAAAIGHWVGDSTGATWVRRAARLDPGFAGAREGSGRPGRSKSRC